MPALFTMILCVLAASDNPRAAAIAAYAESLVGKHEVSGGGRRFHLDSVGVVRAVFLQHGIDVFAAPAQGDIDRSGVDVVYQYAGLNGRFHLRRRPSVGDLCFFGKTRDADRDGEPDLVSHLGIVTDVAADGTATVVTAGRSRVTTLALNRFRPKETVDEAGQTLNGRLFLAGSADRALLAAEAFYTFATLIE